MLLSFLRQREFLFHIYGLFKLRTWKLDQFEDVAVDKDFIKDQL